MGNINLDNVHPDYAETADARRTARDLFTGADAVKEARDRYLFREKNEADDDFELRLKRAVFDPYCEKVVTARQALLFQKPHERKLPKRFENWLWDCDRRGTPAHVFFEECGRNAQIDGIRWVCVDMPRVGELRSAAEEQELGHRPFFESIPGNAVIDWEVGPDGELEWAVVKTVHTPPRGVPGVSPKPEPRWKVWTRREWLVYGGQGGQQQLVDRGTHTAGVVPLVPLLGIRNTDYSGWPVTRSIHCHVLAIYNKWSDLDWFERLSSHPIPYTISPEKVVLLDSGKGVWLKSRADGASVQIGYLEPTGAAFGSARETIRDLQAHLYAIALAQAKKDSAQVQSGDSQREDRRIFASSLATCSRLFEATEQRCWECVARFLGMDPKADREDEKIAITYSRDFDDTTIEASMVAALSSLIDAEVLTRKTVLRAMTRSGLVEVEDEDEELKAAQEEAQSRIPKLVGAAGLFGEADEE